MKQNTANGMREMNDAGKGAGIMGSKETEDGKSGQTDGLSLDEVLAQVEHCVSQLENPQISLEDAFRYYEEGIRRLRTCNDKVVQIEQKMQVINSKGELEDF